MATPTVHTKAEAAEILRVKESWLERRAAARTIPFTMLGGAYCFTDEHLAEIVRLNEQATIPPGDARPALPRTRRRGTPDPNVEALRPRTRSTRQRRAA